MPYRVSLCPFCGESLGRVDQDSASRKRDHLRFNCPKYKRFNKKQNRRNLQALPEGRVVGQAGLPSLGKRKP
jgi:hypothetical protein